MGVKLGSRTGSRHGHQVVMVLMNTGEEVVAFREVAPDRHHNPKQERKE